METSQCSLVGDWLNNQWYLHTINYYMAIEKNNDYLYVLIETGKSKVQKSVYRILPFLERRERNKSAHMRLLIFCQKKWKKVTWKPMKGAIHWENEGWGRDWDGSETSLLKFFFFYFLAAPHGMQDLSSPTRDRTHAPCSGSAEP